MPLHRLATLSYAAAGFGGLLTHDLARGVPSALSYFPSRNWEAVAREIDGRDIPREKVCQILKAGAERTNAPAAVLVNIERLRQPGTYAVATGQQAGLAGGPLFVIYKALSAIKLARTLEASSGGRARFVPIFWVAGDDHDLAEIDHADFLAPDHSLRRVHVKLEDDNAGRSACDVRLDAAQIEEMRKSLHEIMGAEAPADAIAAAYSGRSFSDAYAVLLNSWLGPLGLVVVQSSDVRVLGADLMRSALSDYDVVSRLIQEDGASLERHGYKPGFGRQRPGPQFFISTEPGGIRARLEPLPLDGGNFQESSQAFELRGLKPRTYSRKELEDLIAREPHRFSAAAALRPVLQQSILPVVATILGPGEIDYWAQLKRVHDHFGVPFPVVTPRATLTLVDEQAQTNLRRLGIEPGAPDLFAGEEALKKRVQSSGELSRKIAQRTAAILAELDALGSEVHAVDKGLKPLFDKTRERFAHELARIAEKTSASLSQHEGAGLNRMKQALDFIRPRNSPQERVLTGAQFIAQHPNLPNELLELIDPELREQLVLALGSWLLAPGSWK